MYCRFSTVNIMLVSNPYGKQYLYIQHHGELCCTLLAACSASVVAVVWLFKQQDHRFRIDTLLCLFAQHGCCNTITVTLNSGIMKITECCNFIKLTIYWVLLCRQVQTHNASMIVADLRGTDSVFSSGYTERCIQHKFSLHYTDHWNLTLFLALSYTTCLYYIWLPWSTKTKWLLTEWIFWIWMYEYKTSLQ